MSARVCHLCQNTVTEACPTCTAEWTKRVSENAPASPEVRAEELTALVGIVEFAFDLLHHRITQLVGRDVWTHELAYPDALIDEIRREIPASMTDVLNKIPANKTVVVVDTSESQP